MPPKIRYQYLTKISETAITNRVGAGSSAPQLVNTCLDAGMTKIMINAAIIIATMMMAPAEDVQRLQERPPGRHHGGQLARKQRHVLFRYAAAAAGLALLDFVDPYT